MQNQHHSHAASTTPAENSSAQRATTGLSKQAFREMLAAAERVNRHHTGHLSQQRAA